MRVEQEVIALLKSDVTITALVSTRIYAQRAIQSATPPYMVLQNVSSLRRGGLAEVDDKPAYLIQLDLISATYEGAKSLQQEVRRVLDCVASGNIRWSRLENERDTYDDGTDYYRVGMDFRVQYLDN